VLCPDDGVVTQKYIDALLLKSYVYHSSQEENYKNHVKLSFLCDS
jgi:hypothetical protein